MTWSSGQLFKGAVLEAVLQEITGEGAIRGQPWVSPGWESVHQHAGPSSSRISDGTQQNAFQLLKVQEKIYSIYFALFEQKKTKYIMG